VFPIVSKGKFEILIHSSILECKSKSIKHLKDFQNQNLGLITRSKGGAI